MILAPVRCRGTWASLVVRTLEVRGAGIARSDPACVDPDTTRSMGLQAPLGTDCPHQPTVDAIGVEFASPVRGEVAFAARHGPQTFRPSVGVARKEEG